MCTLSSLTASHIIASRCAGSWGVSRIRARGLPRRLLVMSRAPAEGIEVEPLQGERRTRPGEDPIRGVPEQAIGQVEPGYILNPGIDAHAPGKLVPQILRVCRSRKQQAGDEAAADEESGACGPGSSLQCLVGAACHPHLWCRERASEGGANSQ